MDYAKLKEVIAKVIKENGQGDITGPALQMVLMTMVNSLGEVYPQTYTKEQKAQARANIDALANYDGEITEEKLSSEVQAILDDVANKQNITDESLATIAKTIVGAINEVYKGGLEDASIATSKIEDGAITEPKLETTLKTKVNNNVKVVEQSLTDAEINIASKNLKFRDENNNFFVDVYTYKHISSHTIKPRFSVFGFGCYNNSFDDKCEYNAFGNNFFNNRFGNACTNNIFGNSCKNNVYASYCKYNIIGNGFVGSTFGMYCTSNIVGNDCSHITLGKYLYNSKIDSGVSYVTLKSNANYDKPLQNIHILSGVKGSSSTTLTIAIPDEYLNSSRELIITTKVNNGGPSTPEDLVMYYADEVVDKQNKQDTTLETTSKEVVGAINEVFNGGVKDKSIAGAKLADKAVTTEKIADNSITTEKLKDQAVEYAKLSASIRSTLDMVEARVKVLSSGTDLKAVTEAGVYILSGTATYLNAPTKWEHYNAAILIVTGNNSNSYNQGRTIIGFQNGSRYPFAATLRSNEWTETDLDTALAGKLNNTSTLTDTEINNIWDNN